MLSERDLIEQHIENENYTIDVISALLSDNIDDKTYNEHTRLLALKGQDWVAEFLGDDNPLSGHYKNIKRIYGYFLYRGEDGKNLFIEHVASGKKFNLLKKSIEGYEAPDKNETILVIGMALWQNEWWLSGSYMKIPYNKELIMKEKNSILNKNSLNFLDDKLTKESNKILAKQFEIFKKFNNGSQIAFLPSDRINEFYMDFMIYYNNSLNLSNKEKAKQQKLRDKYSFSQDTGVNFSEIGETGLVFFNHRRGIEIGLEVARAFPLPENPYFDENESTKAFMAMLLSDEFSPELIKFCVENCKDKLPFFIEGYGQFIIDDLDFLLRFFKKNIYHPTPNISLI